MPGHFDTPVVLEAVRPLGTGYECRVRLPDGTLDEVVISLEEAESLALKGTRLDSVRLVDVRWRVRWSYSPRNPAVCNRLPTVI